jgi:phosphohistidine phosphatase
VELYLIRHADAGSRDPKRYPDDSLRPLSVDGKTDMLRVARGMRRVGIEFDHLVDSGYVRARQTSECICDAYQIDRSFVKAMAELAPDTEPAASVTALRKLRGATRLAIVGHEPHLSRLAGYLIAANPDLPLELKKAGVCRVDLSRWNAGSGVLVALLLPKVLRRIGK